MTFSRDKTNAFHLQHEQILNHLDIVFWKPLRKMMLGGSCAKSTRWKYCSAVSTASPFSPPALSLFESWLQLFFRLFQNFTFFGKSSMELKLVFVAVEDLSNSDGNRHRKTHLILTHFTWTQPKLDPNPAQTLPELILNSTWNHFELNLNSTQT